MALTADMARTYIPGYENKLESYINQIDECIKAEARRGSRLYNVVGVNRQYFGDLSKHYKEAGFVVDYYIAPFVELKIKW